MTVMWVCLVRDSAVQHSVAVPVQPSLSAKSWVAALQMSRACSSIQHTREGACHLELLAAYSVVEHPLALYLTGAWQQCTPSLHL